MRIWTMTGVVLSSLLMFGVSSGAAQGNVDGVKYDKGATVTIQGCVVAGEGGGTHVLTNVKEWPIANSPNGIYGPRHYWLDDLKADLSSHVGQTIQVTGTILDLEESEVEREPGGWHGGTRVAIERPGRDVFTSPVNAGVNRADATSRQDMKITLLRLKVEKFMTVMKICLPQLR